MNSRCVFFILAISAAFAAGAFLNRKPPHATQASASDRIRYYHCPMHPSYKSERRGDACCCGMLLEPVRAGDATGAEAIQVSTPNQQLLGSGLPRPVFALGLSICALPDASPRTSDAYSA
jgi:hypothetical protein